MPEDQVFPFNIQTMGKEDVSRYLDGTIGDGLRAVAREVRYQARQLVRSDKGRFGELLDLAAWIQYAAESVSEPMPVGE